MGVLCVCPTLYIPAELILVVFIKIIELKVTEKGEKLPKIRRKFFSVECCRHDDNFEGSVTKKSRFQTLVVHAILVLSSESEKQIVSKANSCNNIVSI